MDKQECQRIMEEALREKVRGIRKEVAEVKREIERLQASRINMLPNTRLS